MIVSDLGQAQVDLLLRLAFMSESAIAVLTRVLVHLANSPDGGGEVQRELLQLIEQAQLAEHAARAVCEAVGPHATPAGAPLSVRIH